MNRLLLLVLTFCLFSCSQESSKLKFQDEGNIYIRVKIAGKEYPFLFDTGASTTIFSHKLIEELGEHAKPIGNDSIVPLTIAKKDNQIISYKPYDQLSMSIGNVAIEASFVSTPDETDNILGMNALSQLHWWFDFQDTTFTVSKKTIHFSPKDMDCLELTYLTNQGATAVPIHFNDSVCRFFIFDSGWGISKPEIKNSDKELNLFELQINTMMDDPQGVLDKFGNIGGRNFVGSTPNGDKLMIFPHLKIENIPMDFVTARFTQHPAFEKEETAGLCGLLSYAFIRGRFSHLIIDPNSRKLRLYSNRMEHIEHTTYVKQFYEQEMKKFFQKLGIPYSEE